MAETRYRLPHEVAAQLRISPSTLRRWSNEFGDFLSDAAGRPQPASSGGITHRRYSDDDMETLMTIKGLLNEGLTYIQLGKRLEALRMRQATTDDSRDTTALGPSLQEGSPIAPVATVLADTLHTVADGQQLLLGSQQANRDLLSVVLQDNFGLKEENTKLRDRMLELERDLAEIRRLEVGQRESLEARLQKLETQARQPVPQPKPAKRSGCLTQIFG
jgi:DNA-binding transcriptional MerR regulator